MDAYYDQSKAALGALLASVSQSVKLRSALGRPVLGSRHFANVLDLGQRTGLGLAISTDGVGSKSLIAQSLEKYDTIGIDCVAMNANDIICVGAEPIAMTDYLAVEIADENMFRQIGEGLLVGARRANITIPGGEVAQLPGMVHGERSGLGFDLVGTCVGTVALDRVLVGQNIELGDLVLGLSSSGVHSNGLSLARMALLEHAKLTLSDQITEFGRTLGEELLEPTTIYVGFAIDLLRRGVNVKAFIHITSDGFLNLLRVDKEVGFTLDRLPEPSPIFNLIQYSGDIADKEMFYVFNMGVGFCAIISPDSEDGASRIAVEHDHTCQTIGRVDSLGERVVRIPSKRLIGRDGCFSNL